MKCENLPAHIAITLSNNPISLTSQQLDYGTSGYRCEASRLKGVAIRIGIFACLRSLQQKGVAIGVMITASHNTAVDNGLKIIDSDGSMLSTEAETSVVEFVRSTPDTVRSWMEKYFPEIIDSKNTPNVYIGWDTRVSSASLAEEVRSGVQAVGGQWVDFGLVTTPQLHLSVQKQRKIEYTHDLAKRFASCFSSLAGERANLNVDCAHGVGSLAINSLAEYLDQEFSKSSYPVDSPQLSIRAFNTLTNEVHMLNKNCGADHVKFHCCLPELTPREENAFSTDARWATIDGDADRLLYFVVSPSTNNKKQIALLDGDRIACLFASFIKSQFDLFASEPNLRLGIVQTAYSNSASTQYLEEKLGIRAVCSLTGVKHLHSMASQFDFGVYFEANGHGTVLMSNTAKKFVSSLPSYHCLRGFASLVNTCIGDALADLLLVEYVLAVRHMSLQAWLDCYTEFPSRQLKVYVANKSTIELTDVERRVAVPENLQPEIDTLVAEVGRAVGNHTTTRAFIRPSGTEDVIRVYAESATQKAADWLATAVAHVVYKIAGGVGNPPDPVDPFLP